VKILALFQNYQRVLRDFFFNRFL